MTLRESLGEDVQRIYEQVDALLDKEDGILAFFDGHRVITYGQGFGISASQLEFISVEFERALRNGVGQQPSTLAKKRRTDERTQGVGSRDDLSGDHHRAADHVLQLARKIA
jgi:hypothetical protein